jgi:hypothetical protein
VIVPTPDVPSPQIKNELAADVAVKSALRDFVPEQPVADHAFVPVAAQTI